MLIIQYMIFSLVMKTRELFGCAAAGIFISTLPDAQDFYYNTAIIGSVCEFRANMKKYNIYPLKWSKQLFKNICIDNYLLLNN